MNTATAAVLEPIDEARIALESVDIQAGLRGLMSEVEVTQTYRNLESHNVEAVYTFPLPLDAVLLELTLELNGKKLQGKVEPKTEAEERYEQAIEDGDSAILLQNVEPGIFTMNVGNIQPNEQATVRFRHAQLHHWRGDSLRFHLPTTIAPRYGDPFASGMAAHQVPTYVLSVDHGFSLAVLIEGDLAQANFECPSHPIIVSMSAEVRKISLSGGSALMDRDFVLNVKKPPLSKVEGWWTQDEKESVALASFHPEFPEHFHHSPRCVKFVVDCSGSMGGASIGQAKSALREIISLLNPNDHFNLIKFGTGFEMLFHETVAASKENIKAAAFFLDHIDADMGGTELGKALKASYRCGSVKGLPTDLMLITDGHVWNSEEDVAAAQASGHRIFTVGVGSAVSEAFVRRIAETTSGACELVSPRENMSECIVRHFMRIDQRRASSVRIEWTKTPIRQFPAEVGTVYAGDTIHVFGWFRGRPADNARLVMTCEDGRTVTQEAPISKEHMDSGKPLSSLPRIASYSRLQTLGGTEAAKLAERYQLVTEHTSCVLAYERDEDEKSSDIPALRTVPQVLAHGWGEITHIRESSNVVYSGRIEADLAFAGKTFASSQFIGKKRRNRIDLSDRIITTQFSLDPSASYPGEAPSRFERLIEGLNNRYSDRTAAHLDIGKVDQLTVIGLDRETRNRLMEIVDKDCTEANLVVCFLTHLLNSEFGDGLSRHARRMIRKASRQHAVPEAAIGIVTGLIDGCY